jgi:hypothetical protein
MADEPCAAFLFLTVAGITLLSVGMCLGAVWSKIEDAPMTKVIWLLPAPTMPMGTRLRSMGTLRMVRKPLGLCASAQG